MVGLALVVATGCLRVPLPGPPPGPQPDRIAVYGDSLLHSAGPRWRWIIASSLPDWGTVDRTEWGTAPCDHLEQMEADARSRWNIRVVVLAYFGNQATPCTQGHDVETLYRADLLAAVELWRTQGVRVVLAVPPGRVDDEPLSPGARAALDVAEQGGVELVDLTGTFVDPTTGRYARELDGEVVRSDDGVHLCEPGPPDPLVCPADAPGVVLFADPVVDAAVGQARLVK